MRTGNCRGCGRPFTFPDTGPIRGWCPDPECKRRRHARAGWRSVEKRILARGLLAELPAWMLRPDQRTFSGRFRDHDEVAWLYEVILARDPCSYCGTYEPGRMTPDHIISFAAGGEGVWDNLTSSCHRCNSSKSDAPLLVWMLTSPRLTKLRFPQLELIPA